MPIPMEDDKRKKTIAYLIDRQTIRILDLVTSQPVATILHTTKIDWLELNRRATKLLFRDKNRQLYLYNIATQVSLPISDGSAAPRHTLRPPSGGT